jgi:hypothetical protein
MNRSAPLPLEILESRILLSNSSSQQPMGIVTGYDLVAPIALAPATILPASPTGRELEPAIVMPTGPIGPRPAVTLSALAAAMKAAAVKIVHTEDVSSVRGVGGASVVAASRLGWGTPVLTITSYSQVTLGEEAIPPVIVTPLPSPPARPAVPAPRVNTPLPPSHPTPPTSVPVVAKSAPPTLPPPRVPPAQSPSLPSAGSLGTSLPNLPVARHVQVDASLDTDHSSMTIVIPVGPATQAVGVSVHSATAQAASEAPVLDQMVLLDQDGSTIDEVADLQGPQAGAPSNAVTVALNNAPAGGDLLVEVSVPSGSPAAANAGAGPTQSDWALPVVVDIQRQDAAVPPAPVVLSTTGNGAMGSLPQGGTATPAPRATPAPGVSSPGGRGAADTLTVAGADQSQGSAPLEDPTKLSGEHEEVWAIRVATGPLAARSAAPLGPMLATVLADPAPPVDRHERALSQAIDGLASDADGDPGARRSELASLEESGPTAVAARADDRSAEPDEGTSVVALIGLGLSPSEGTAAVSSPGRDELAALLETLPSSVGSEQPPAIVVDAEPGLTDLALALSIPRRDLAEEMELPDNITAACGFVLILGLCYGPQLPDLLAVAQARSSARRGAIPAAMAARRRAAWI